MSYLRHRNVGLRWLHQDRVQHLWRCDQSAFIFQDTSLDDPTVPDRVDFAVLYEISSDAWFRAR